MHCLWPCPYRGNRRSRILPSLTIGHDEAYQKSIQQHTNPTIEPAAVPPPQSQAATAAQSQQAPGRRPFPPVRRGNAVVSHNLGLYLGPALPLLTRACQQDNKHACKRIWPLGTLGSSVYGSRAKLPRGGVPQPLAGGRWVHLVCQGDGVENRLNAPTSRRPCGKSSRGSLEVCVFALFDRE